MKKQKFMKGIACMTLATLSVAIPNTAWAAEEIRVQGYLEHHITEEDILVTGVIEKLDPSHIVVEEFYGDPCDAAVVIKPSSKITILQQGSDLMVYKLKKQGNTYVLDTPVSLTEGKVEIYVESGEVDENGVEGVEAKSMDTKDFKEGMTTEMPLYQIGAGITLTQPGEYIVIFRYPALAGFSAVYARVEGTASTIDKQTQIKQEGVQQVQPTASKVLVAGEEVKFEAYTINNSNYFKLRDLAYVLNGTSKTCNIEWNAESQAIAVIPDVPYEKTGNELIIGDQTVKTGKENTLAIKKLDEVFELKAYNIEGSNYVRLRDVEALLGIVIGYDQETKTITID